MNKLRLFLLSFLGLAVSVGQAQVIKLENGDQAIAGARYIIDAETKMRVRPDKKLYLQREDGGWYVYNSYLRRYVYYNNEGVCHYFDANSKCLAAVDSSRQNLYRCDPKTFNTKLRPVGIELRFNYRYDMKRRWSPSFRLLDCKGNILKEVSGPVDCWDWIEGKLAALEEKFDLSHEVIQQLRDKAQMERLLMYGQRALSRGTPAKKLK